MQIGNRLLQQGFIAALAIAGLVLGAGAANGSSPADQAPNPLPPHPRLLLNAQGIAELKQRIAESPWARASWAELNANADQSLARPVTLPPRGGNWSHNYVCPTHGARLSQGRKLGPWEWEHRCPVGPHTLRGDPAHAKLDFDGNAIAAAHGRLAEQVVEQGLVFQVTGDARYAARAREILLAYAERYLTYPLHDNQGQLGRGGRVASQSLTEAGWLRTFTQGADLVWTTLSKADRSTIAEKVLLPALKEVILPRRLGIHNIQCHHNSAIGLVGFLLGDEKLIATAIEDPTNGYRQQMAKGVLGDGMWTEGSSGYHFYTIAGVLPLTEAARNCGRDLYGPKLQSMFDGPLALAMPDFVLPNFNDSGTVPLAREDDLYEVAFARFGNPAYVPLLTTSDRRGRLALLYGVARLPSGEPEVARGSRNSPASGYAILQKGQGSEATWLCVKYGAHGGGHGHPDKNNFILYARGQIVAPDAGTHAYGSPLHSAWDKTTLAHNTLVVDETSQERATGKCLGFGTELGVDYVITDAGSIYAGVRFIRTAALLTTNLVVFVDQVMADRPRTLDLAYHQMGNWEDLPTGTPWKAPSTTGYRYFSDTTARANTAAGSSVRTKITDAWRPTVSLAPSDEPTALITGYGILKTTEDRVPMLVQRRQARKTAFVWAISLDGSPVTLRSEKVADAGRVTLSETEAVLVNVSSAGRRWTFLTNPRQLSLVIPRSDGTDWRTEAVFAVP